MQFPVVGCIPDDDVVMAKAEAECISNKIGISHLGERSFP